MVASKPMAARATDGISHTRSGRGVPSWMHLSNHSSFKHPRFKRHNRGVSHRGSQSRQQPPLARMSSSVDGQGSGVVVVVVVVVVVEVVKPNCSIAARGAGQRPPPQRSPQSGCKHPPDLHMTWKGHCGPPSSPPWSKQQPPFAMIVSVVFGHSPAGRGGTPGDPPGDGGGGGGGGLSGRAPLPPPQAQHNSPELKRPLSNPPLQSSGT